MNLRATWWLWLIAIVAVAVAIVGWWYILVVLR